MQLPDIRPDHIELVRQILQQHVPRAQAWVFGSRAKWTARDTSDLDLCINASEAMTFEQMGALREAFEDSNLPYKVDVVDWATTSEAFRAIIDQSKVPLPLTGGETAKAAGRAVCGRGGVMGEWTTEPLDDCLESLIDYRGKSPTKSLTGIPVLSAKVVKTTGLLRPIEQTIAPDYYPRWMTRGLPRPGDVVMTTEAPMGEVIQLNEETSKFALGQRIVCMRGKANKLDDTFLRYLLTSPGQQEILASYSTGTTVLGISQKALRSVPISFPTFNEQIEIGELLSALDDKIELNRRMNETLEASARALFRDWFVDFGPVKAKAAAQAALGGSAQNDGAKASLRGSTQNHQAKAAPATPTPATLAPEIWSLFPAALDDEGKPEGWEWGTLGDIARCVNAKVEPNQIDPDTPYIGLEHMPRQSIALNEWEGAGKVSSGKSSFKAGQILFGKLRPYFHKVGLAPVDGICSTDIVVIEAKQPYYAALVLACVSTEDFVAFTDKGSTGTKMPRTSWTIMGGYQLVKPERQLAEKFETVVGAMYEKIIANIQESRTLAQTRDMLLPKLMSGEIRVADGARAADDTAGVAR